MKRIWDLRIIARAAQEFLWTLQFKGFTEQLINNIREDSFYPELPRKSKAARVLDNLHWYLRYGEINRYYNSYGFDVRGLRDQREYLPRNRFRQQRNNLNLRVSAHGYTRICILRDKAVFSSYMASQLGSRYVIRELGRILPDGQVIALTNAQILEETSLSAFISDMDGDVFVKLLKGECGENCYLVEGLGRNEGSLFVNGKTCTTDELQKKLLGSEYLIQPRLMQHPLLARLNPSCVNTLRIITIVGRKTKKPQIFAHFLRLGVNSPVDNRAAGGLAVLVDENGILRGKGIGHHAVYESHPVTGIHFEGYSLPYWDEVRQLVLRAHTALMDIPAIGWDVAFLPDGPVLIEGNDNWEICGVQDTIGGVRERWKKFIYQ